MNAPLSDQDHVISIITIEHKIKKDTKLSLTYTNTNTNILTHTHMIYTHKNTYQHTKVHKRIFHNFANAF